ncbi:hypothetical protein C5167_018483 [Papaver somniferum]|uniref:Uncharacterized protein n=1 Tax=Papaver somniferum TaxID=3469 RepID=A0A4Y7IQS2_PAPSO|nr:hypothetical protein C5167_018483 [Papaver somniferum]
MDISSYRLAEQLEKLLQKDMASNSGDKVIFQRFEEILPLDLKLGVTTSTKVGFQGLRDDF